MTLPRLALAGLILTLLLLTKPESYGDTIVYVNSIILASRKSVADGLNPLWEFGHLFWRPIGNSLWLTIDSWQILRDNFDQIQRAYLPFVAINIAAGILGGVLFYAIVRKFVGDSWKALLATTGLLTSHAYLNYWQSGTAYVPGLTCLIGGLFFADRVRRGGEPYWNSIAAGLSLAFGVLLWLPYVLAAPAIAFALVAPLQAERQKLTSRARVKSLLLMTLVTGLTGLVGYGIAAKANHISSAKEFADWAGESSHGVEQTKRLLRLPTALPRTLVHVGEDGILLKRFVLKDPYARVSVFDLMRGSILKMVIFYVVGALMAYALFQTGEGRWALGLLGVAVALNVFFAVAVFEPSQMERYLPSYPFLWLAVAIALKSGRLIPAILGTAIVLMAINNTYALSSLTRGSSDDATFARRALLRGLPPGSRIVLLSFKDELWRQQARLPFHSEMRVALPVYDVLETGMSRAAETWRPAWASTCLESLQVNGEVWMSERLFQERPLPDWKWVEGDQPGVKWADFPEFFRNYEYGEKRGGEDGFRRLLPSQSNLEKLRSQSLPTPRPTR